MSTKSGESQAYDYDPYGMLMPGRTLAGATKEGFTGKERDSETSLDYFGQRVFMPAFGRWSTIDPVADSFPEWNPYNYVEGNPVSLTDPFGLCVHLSRPECRQRAAAGGTTGAVAGSAVAVACLVSGGCAVVVAGALVVGSALGGASSFALAGEAGDQLSAVDMRSLGGKIKRGLKELATGILIGLGAQEGVDQSILGVRGDVQDAPNAAEEQVKPPRAVKDTPTVNMDDRARQNAEQKREKKWWVFEPR